MTIDLTPNALVVLQKRYLAKDKSGQVMETPEQMFRRVAENVAAADRIYEAAADIQGVSDQFYRLMSSLEFLPNSPTLMNAGRELQQLAACFVLPVEDSLEGIFESVKQAALIHQSGGGTGFSFSRLRPRNDVVASTGGAASGPVSFMRVFNMATEVIKQGGTRRGANMGILRVDHPDILDFITIKRDHQEMTNFNLSVAVTDGFMEAVKKDEEYDLVNPRSRQAVKRIKAKMVFDLMAESAWDNGDPGILFIDRVNRANPTPQLGMIESTNPCGEQPLLPYEPCNLGSINLVKMIKQAADGTFEMDYPKLEQTVAYAVHFLDNVIDANRYPLPQIEAMARGNRKIGLGVMGFADLLVQLKIPYNSPEALKVSEEVMGFIEQKAKEASVRIAERRGVFPNYSGSIYEKKGVRLRNATVTTIAPTGTLSIIAGCSSGIEPLYGVSYIRYALEGIELPEINPGFLEMAEKEGLNRPEVKEKVQGALSIQGIPGIPEKLKKLFVTAFDLTPEEHVRIQAAFQKFTDNAVSKTVNLNPEASVEEVKQAFLLAYELGCKGVTVFRSGSRNGQVLTCARCVEEEGTGMEVKREEG